MDSNSREIEGHDMESDQEWISNTLGSNSGEETTRDNMVEVSQEVHKKHRNEGLEWIDRITTIEIEKYIRSIVKNGDEKARQEAISERSTIKKRGRLKKFVNLT